VARAEEERCKSLVNIIGVLCARSDGALSLFAIAVTLCLSMAGMTGQI